MKIFLVIMLLLVPPPPRALALTTEEAWKVLGLRPGASPEQIKQAHRALAKKFHPDKTGGDKAAEAMLVDVNIANDILLGKRAPTPPPGGSARPGTGSGGGFRDFGFEDFAPGAPKRGRAYQPPEDAFVRRFFLQHEAALEPPLRKTLEDYVKLADRLFAGKLTDELIKLQGSVEEATGHADLARKIFFTMMGEHGQRPGTRAQADQTLKAYFAGKAGTGLDRALDEATSYQGETRLKGPDGNWAEAFPETTRAILGHPGLPDVSPDTQRRVFLVFSREAGEPKLAAFYRDLARDNPLWRGKRLEAEVKEYLRPNRQRPLPDPEMRRRARNILAELQAGGIELDGVRVLIYEELLAPGWNPREFPEFLAEIRKIRDFSRYELRRGLSVGIFSGPPERIAAHQELIREMLQLVRDRDPQKFAEEKAAFPRSFAQWGTKGWEPALEFINPLLADAPAAAPATAELRMQAERCAREYARISKIIGGAK